MTRQERVLAIVLRLLSIPLLLAVPCAMLPFAWMDAAHRWLGLDQLPDAPIVDYLARTCSLFYAMHGAIILFVSFDVRRYLAFIRFFAWLGVAFGIAMVVVDHVAGLPVYWRWMEGAIIVGESGVILWLAQRIRPPTTASQTENPAQLP